MQTARAPLALFVRVLVGVQILLSLSNPLAPLAAAPTVRPAVQGPRLDFESGRATTRRTRR